MEKDEIMRELVMSWLERAEGKGSHAGFQRCIEEAINYLVALGAPDDVIYKLRRYSDLHRGVYWDPVVEWLDWDYERDGEPDGTMPTIRSLEIELELSE